MRPAPLQLPDLELDGPAGIAASQEPRVQHVHAQLGRHGASGGEQRHRDHLATEDPVRSAVAHQRTESPWLDPLQIQGCRQGGSGSYHGN